MTGLAISTLELGQRGTLSEANGVDTEHLVYRDAGRLRSHSSGCRPSTRPR